ncbi:MAG: MFS transporter [Alphaproteobacteria bacterium]|nr:MFS transporter [Alphaproteobacteria bacterium]
MNLRAYGFKPEDLRGRLSGILGAIIIASVLAVGSATITAFDHAVEPELSKKTRLIGSIVRSDIQRALEAGIPFDAIVGLDVYLIRTIRKFDEINRITVRNAEKKSIGMAARDDGSSTFGTSIFSDVFSLPQSTFDLPILDGNRLVGGITIEINPLFVETRLRGVLLDIMVIALVAILIALELALAVAVTSVGKPLQRVYSLLDEQQTGRFLHYVRPGGLGGIGRAAERLNDRAHDLANRLAAIPASARARIDKTLESTIAKDVPARLRLSVIHDIRLTLFLYAAATEISASFLPVYARNAVRPEWLTPELAAAAPLVLYLASVTVLSPFGGKLVRRFGARNLFMVSVLPTALALVAMGLSENVIVISVWRGFLAVFFAIATIACQEYALRADADQGGSKPISTFVAVVYGGVFCGSAMGGVIAGRFGFDVAFVSGAMVAVLSGFLAIFAMQGQAGDQVAVGTGLPEESSTMRSPDFRFWMLLVGVAVPMSAATAIFIWYLTPLMLADLKAGPADIARVVMLYYLATVIFSPFIAKLSDGRVGPSALVVAGALASGGALLSLGVWSGFWAIVTAVAGLGLGHAFMRAPLYALAHKISDGSASVFSVLRLAERVGAILGLIASALLLDDFGSDVSINALGVVVLFGSALYAVGEIAGRPRSG